MTNKRPKPEEIFSKLRQVEVLMGQDTCSFHDQEIFFSTS